MLILAASDKGGTGRTVTGCNLAYQGAMMGYDVCYLDFDFGSPTAGTVFHIGSVDRGTDEGGLHSYVTGVTATATEIDVWRHTDRTFLRARSDDAGELVLYPGDHGRGEFSSTPDIVERCVDFIIELESKFDMIFVDLSAGRSHAAQIMLESLARPSLKPVVSRWLVFHRWTRQHIIAASGLVYGSNGLMETGVSFDHVDTTLQDQIRFVRTAYVSPDSPSLAGLTSTQVSWLTECDADLNELAGSHGVGRTRSLGGVPLDPVLQWREQILTEEDTSSLKIANVETVQAFRRMCELLHDDAEWISL